MNDQHTTAQTVDPETPPARDLYFGPDTEYPGCRYRVVQHGVPGLTALLVRELTIAEQAKIFVATANNAELMAAASDDSDDVDPKGLGIEEQVDMIAMAVCDDKGVSWGERAKRLPRALFPQLVEVAISVNGLGPDAEGDIKNA